MMLDNSSYNKIKLMHELSKTIWFIQKHALADAQAAGDSRCIELLTTLSKDLEKSMEKIQKSVCLITQ